MTTTAFARIAYIAPRYIPHTGGVQTHVAQLARRAAAHGYQVEVLTQDSDRRLPAVEVIDGVTVWRFPVWVPDQTYTVAPGLWAYLARYHTRYDVVHAHGYHAVPALGAALAGCRPLVFTPQCGAGCAGRGPFCAVALSAGGHLSVIPSFCHLIMKLVSCDLSVVWTGSVEIGGTPVGAAIVVPVLSVMVYTSMVLLTAGVAPFFFVPPTVQSSKWAIPKLGTGRSWPVKKSVGRSRMQSASVGTKSVAFLCTMCRKSSGVTVLFSSAGPKSKWLLLSTRSSVSSPVEGSCVTDA